MSRILPSSDRALVFEPGFMSPAAEPAIRDAVLQHVPNEDLSTLTQTLYLDTRLALADQLFLYFDRMSMAESLEVRVPFADHQLVSFCLSLPDRRRVWLMRRKELLRRASQGLVTDQVLRKKKQGFFRYAMGLWLSHHQGFVRDVLLDERARSRGQLRLPAVARLIDGAGHLGIKSDQQLLCLLLLEQWQRVFVDADSYAATRTAAAIAA